MNNSMIRILVIDDEEMIVTILKSFLEEKGFQVTGMSDSEAAQKLLQKQSFDVVFTDLMMPTVTGMDIIHGIRAQENDTQIIIFTGFASVESAIEAVQQGVYDYIRKPFRLEEIDNILAHALDQQKLRRDNIALRKKLEKMWARVTMLYDISNILYQVDDHDQTIEMMFDTLREGMGIETAFFLEPEDSGAVRITHRTGLPSDWGEEISLQLPQSIGGQPLNSEEVLLLPILDGQIEIGTILLEIGEHCKTLVLLPILYQEIIRGFLGIFLREDGDLEVEDEVSLLKVLATQVAPLFSSRETDGSRPGYRTQVESDLSRVVQDRIHGSEGDSQPVSFAVMRLINSGTDNLEATSFFDIRESWYKLVSGSVGAGKELHWAGFDTLMVSAPGGNPVGLEHACADIRHQIEEEFPGVGQDRGLSMSYAIRTYPFDSDQPTHLVDSLASTLFLQGVGGLQPMEH